MRGGLLLLLIPGRDFCPFFFVQGALELELLSRRVFFCPGLVLREELLWVSLDRPCRPLSRCPQRGEKVPCCRRGDEVAAAVVGRLNGRAIPPDGQVGCVPSADDPRERARQQ